MKIEPKCPYCGSKEYVREDHFFEGDACIVRCGCKSCGRDFTEVFEVTEIVKPEEQSYPGA